MPRGTEHSLARTSAQVAGKPLVVPGEPEASYLYEKVRCEVPQVGQPMPPTGLMDEADLALLRAYIDGLEPEDSGCGCASTGRTSAPWDALPVFVVALYLLRRARKGRPTGSKTCNP